MSARISAYHRRDSGTAIANQLRLLQAAAACHPPSKDGAEASKKSAFLPKTKVGGRIYTVDRKETIIFDEEEGGLDGKPSSKTWVARAHSASPRGEPARSSSTMANRTGSTTPVSLRGNPNAGTWPSWAHPASTRGEPGRSPSTLATRTASTTPTPSARCSSSMTGRASSSMAKAGPRSTTPQAPTGRAALPGVARRASSSFGGPELGGSPHGQRPHARWPQPCISWSLRYAELLGTCTLPVEDTSDVDAKDELSPRASGAGLEKSSRSETQKSVFLATRPKDQRIVRMESRLSKALPTKRERPIGGRRNAIWHVGQHRRLVNAAVSKVRRRSPERFRELLRAGNSATDGHIEGVAPKMLDAYEVEGLSGRVGLEDHDVQTLYSAFVRYDTDESGSLGFSEVRRLISDLGLQPRTMDEKVEVDDVLGQLWQEDKDIEFEDFLAMVKQIRERLRAVQHDMCVRLFKRADGDGTERLDNGEVLDSLGKLCLAPRNQVEGDVVMKIFAECDSDKRGSLSFHEFQDCVQRVRMGVQTLRREEEMNIAKHHRLDAGLVDEFQMDLPTIWRTFNVYRHQEARCVTRVDVAPLLIDLGVLPWGRSPDQTKRQRWFLVKSVMEAVACDSMQFVDLLRLIREIRQVCKRHFADEVWARFRTSGSDSTELVGRLEIYKVLGEFDMLPRSREEQQDISTVIDRLDVDGSGTFDAGEFQDFFQRLTEYVQQNERRRETQELQRLGLSEVQVALLRRLYCILSPDGCDGAGLLDSARSMKLLPELLSIPAACIDHEKLKVLIGSARQADMVTIDFVDFSRMAKSLLRGLDEPGAEDPREPTSRTEAGGLSGGGSRATSPSKVRRSVGARAC